MIWKIIKSEFKPLQTLTVLLVMLIGFSIILLASRFYFDVRSSFQTQDLWQHEHIIISKKIKGSNTISQLFGKGKKAAFSEREIQDILSQDFVKEVAPFTASSFKASAYIENKQLANFYTELFFESVPSKYIDLPNDKVWGWKQTDEFIPIILPKTYLNLYNFGFAPAQNLPQINEEAAFSITFYVIIKGNGLEKTFKSRVVGFSDRLNTILVPQSFLNYANSTYGTTQLPTSRLILLTPDPSAPELLNYLEAKNYDYNKEQLNNGKARMLLNTATLIVSVTGLLIILLSLWLFILSSQLLLQRNDTKISKLKALGYTKRQIIKPFRNLSFIGSALVFSFSLIPYFSVKNLYRKNLATILSENAVSDLWIIAFGLLFIFILAEINIIFIQRKINKLNINH